MTALQWGSFLGYATLAHYALAVPAERIALINHGW